MILIAWQIVACIKSILLSVPSVKVSAVKCEGMVENGWGKFRKNVSTRILSDLGWQMKWSAYNFMFMKSLWQVHCVFPFIKALRGPDTAQLSACTNVFPISLSCTLWLVSIGVLHQSTNLLIFLTHCSNLTELQTCLSTPKAGLKNALGLVCFLHPLLFTLSQ